MILDVFLIKIIACQALLPYLPFTTKNALMLRYLFAFILLVHGLIHLMGFVKAFKLADIQQLTQPISKPLGILWLVTAVLFVAAVALFLFQHNAWWMVALPAVVLSQVLIFGVWQDAKFGTIANLIALAGIVLAIANWNFQTMAQREKQALLSQAKMETETITRDLLAGLPPIVQKWLERSNVIGKKKVQTVHLQQTGEMRTTPDGNWMPFSAEQYFTTNPPGFIWTADVQMMSGISFAGRDLYTEGKGHMLIKVLSLVPVADARGAETDQGTLIRYLAEICWFPSAALNDYLTWEQIDSISARATMRYGDITASGVFSFAESGDMQSFEADRYYDRPEGATLERWHVETIKTGEFNGRRVPVQSEVSWKLADGDYTWLRLEITDISYNGDW